MRRRAWGLLLCVWACAPGAELPLPDREVPAPGVTDTEEDVAPVPPVLDEDGTAPVPSEPAPPESGTAGQHLWTREVAGLEDPWKAHVALNDAGVTGMLSLLLLPWEPEQRQLASIELLGWNLEGQEQWRRQVPGKAPTDDDRYYPWNYAVKPLGAGFLVVNSDEWNSWGSNIDFGCAEAQVGGGDRLLFLDGRGQCTRSLSTGDVAVGVTAWGSDVWVSQRCHRCLGTYWPSMKRFNTSGQLVHELPVGRAPMPQLQLLHEGTGTMLSWNEGATVLSRRAETFDVLWTRTLPIHIVAPPAVLPGGELGVVGQRVQGQGFSFGQSTLPAGDDLVLLRLSAQGEPLRAVGTGIPEPRIGDKLATDSSGLVIVLDGETKKASVVALSWKGQTRWMQTLRPQVSEGCELHVTSVASHSLHGVRVAGVLADEQDGPGSCGQPPSHRRTFVVAFSR
jgi:hypothetical protein